ncbi:MAG: hypothetical protein H8D96_00070 [Desulfobacterales bacterium]|uniref:Uncharacterized protein n=1 Tax=Candidatus Desulfatibia vada TaxID=2841696 RepID=A0A8J6TIQ3_9BACT|nr:hypothetical protein [Candidatus Desulfatibia vada]
MNIQSLGIQAKNSDDIIGALKQGFPAMKIGNPHVLHEPIKALLIYVPEVILSSHFHQTLPHGIVKLFQQGQTHRKGGSYYAID